MISINRKAIHITLLVVTVLLIVADIVGPSIGITSMLRLQAPGSLPVWFESVLYLAGAGLLAVTAITRFQQKDPVWWRWGVFSLFILFLSVNTSLDVDTRLISGFFGVNQWMWRVIDRLFFMALVIAVVVIIWPVLKDMPVRYRRMLILSGVVFGTGAVFVDAVGSILFNGQNGLLYLIEEFLEFYGFVLFINAMLAYLGAEVGEISFDLREEGSLKSEGG